MDDPLEDMMLEMRRHSLAMDESANMMRDGLKLAVTGIEMVNNRFHLLDLEGWSSCARICPSTTPTSRASIAVEAADVHLARAGHLPLAHGIDGDTPREAHHVEAAAFASAARLVASAMENPQTEAHQSEAQSEAQAQSEA